MTSRAVSFYLILPRRPAFFRLIFQVSVFVVTTVEGSSIPWIALKGIGAYFNTSMSVLTCIVICAVWSHLDLQSRNHILFLIVIQVARNVPDPSKICMKALAARYKIALAARIVLAMLASYILSQTCLIVALTECSVVVVTARTIGQYIKWSEASSEYSPHR